MGSAGQGDVVQRIDQNGIASPIYEYDSFGNQRGRIETDLDIDPNPFRYCGEYFDSESNTLYLRNRRYDARNGRFTQEDPIGSGLNWYSYCDGNPVAYTDPWGLKASYLFDEDYMDKYILNDGVIDDDEILYLYEHAANGPDDFSPEVWEIIMSEGLAELFEGRTDAKGPGYKFDSDDDAAIDAAKYMAPISIYFDWEFGAYIYEWEEEKKKWFGGTKAVKYYSYTTPITSKNYRTVDMELNPVIYRDRHTKGNLVAVIHSHGAETAEINDEIFSGEGDDNGDEDWAAAANNGKGIRIYLITPAGYLYMFDPNKHKSGDSDEISKKMPYDVDAPNLGAKVGHRGPIPGKGYSNRKRKQGG